MWWIFFLIVTWREFMVFFKNGPCVYIFWYVNDSYLHKVWELVQQIASAYSHKSATVALMESFVASRTVKIKSSKRFLFFYHSQAESVTSVFTELIQTERVIIISVKSSSTNLAGVGLEDACWSLAGCDLLQLLPRGEWNQPNIQPWLQKYKVLVSVQIPPSNCTSPQSSSYNNSHLIRF